MSLPCEHIVEVDDWSFLHRCPMSHIHYIIMECRCPICGTKWEERWEAKEEEIFYNPDVASIWGRCVYMQSMIDYMITHPQEPIQWNVTKLNYKEGEK